MAFWLRQQRADVSQRLVEINYDPVFAKNPVVNNNAETSIFASAMPALAKLCWEIAQTTNLARRGLIEVNIDLAFIVCT